MPEDIPVHDDEEWLESCCSNGAGPGIEATIALIGMTRRADIATNVANGNSNSDGDSDVTSPSMPDLVPISEDDEIVLMRKPLLWSIEYCAWKYECAVDYVEHKERRRALKMERMKQGIQPQRRMTRGERNRRSSDRAGQAGEKLVVPDCNCN
jgi:hypothetical protein